MQLSKTIKRKHVILTSRLVVLTSFIFLIFSSTLSGQEADSYDEISVFLNIPRVGGGEIDAVIVGEKLYLPVTNLFDFLKIRNIPDPELKSISGFFINPQAEYKISRTELKITYQDQSYTLHPGDLIRTENNLYLLSSYFGKVFGLDCKFDFRNLSVIIDSKLELPLIREMKQEEMRKNLKRLKGETKADTTIGRTYPGFRFGMADWSISASQEINGKSSAQMNLALGAMVAGGEANTSIYYNTASAFNWKYQQYLWRYVDNDFSPLRQISAGKIATNSISTLFNPVVGVQLTNTPTTYRRSFGSYTLSDYTEPDWIVELYVNNVMVDYVKADASGFYTFEVPLVYGNTIVNLKFIGPWGEEKTKEQNINIPFTFLPVKTLEYSVSGGFVLDTLHSKYSRVSINYGLFKSMTIGGGAEYLSSISSQPAMPYLNTSLRITNNLLLTSEYTYGVRSKSTLSYRLPSNVLLNLNYTLYHKNQKAISYNYSEERKASLSIPLHLWKFSTYQRFSFNQILMPASKYSTGEWLFSGSFFNINTNITTYALFVSSLNTNVYSNIALSFRLPAGIVCLPQVQYGYTQNKLLSAKVELQKHLFAKAYLDISFEHNNTLKTNMAQLQLRYDFSFAQAGATVTRSNKVTSFSQYARGSLINDSKTKYLGTDNRTNVGKGAISIIPYLDLNANGVRDTGEPLAFGLNIHANGGRIEKSDRDTTIRILGLEPYTSCFIELDPNSFDNVAWKLPYKTLSVNVDPNIMKHVEIPVQIAGEGTGTVYIIRNGEKTGLNRIIVTFFDERNKIAGKTLTEDDGTYNYLGLIPGSYYVRVDTTQLIKLGLNSDPVIRKFSVLPGIEGAVISGLDFTLRSKVIDSTTSKQFIITPPVVRKDTTIMVVHEVTQESVTITEDNYSIQLGAFQKKSNADALRDKLEKLLGRKVEIVTENDLYKVRINDIKDRPEADAVIEQLRKNGITELWLISLKAKRQQYISSQKQDTITTITETTIQAGAFRLMSNAQTLKDLLAKSIYQKVVITYENGYYKVRIIGTALLKETILEEMRKLAPLKDLQLNDLWVVPVNTQKAEEPPETLKTEVVPPEKVEEKIKVPAIVKPDSISKPVETRMQPPVLPPQPAFSLQVGVFYKKSEAIRAQRKIISKLKLPVEIVQQWEYYRVIIPGFFTKEETYKYYPELAGLGYPGVSLIEKR